MKLKEVIQAIDASKERQEFMHELSLENKKLLSQRIGTFEAVLTGKGDDKVLIPEVGVVHYLYRGQNEEFDPCLPTIYRGSPNDAQIFLQRMRLVQFQILLKSHPVVTRFFAKNHFLVDEEGLAQHYGLKTEVLDLTSSLDVALFFATCKYNPKTDSYDYYHDTGIHEGVLYVFDPMLDNESVPSFYMDKYMNGNITPIGLQAFPRPGAQFGYALHIKKGYSTKSWMFRFTFTSEDSKYYFELFKKGESLWIKDKLIGKTKQIIEQTSFSYSLFKETFKKFRPKGWSKNKMKMALYNEGVVLVKKQNDVVFDKKEQQEIVDEWNNNLGETTCAKIVRKCWFEHEGTEKIDGSDEETVKGCRNYSDFNSLSHIAIYMMLSKMLDPKGPDGAEWKNYINSPRAPKKRRQKEGQWEKVPASMTLVWGKPYLLKEDWKILWQD